MNTGKTVFSQLMSFLPTNEFNKSVEKYKGNHHVRNFNCKDHFYVMGFAQLTYRVSLRDIESCLKAFSNKLYHSGIKQSVPKSKLAKANESRDWRIYADYSKGPEFSLSLIKTTAGMVCAIVLKNLVFQFFGITISLI